MIPYYTIFFMLTFFVFANYIKEFRQIRLLFYIFSVLILILFAGLRASHVAFDYDNYVERFVMVPDIGYWFTGEFVYTFTEVRMEPAYIAVGALIKTFTNEHIWMFLSVAFLSVGIASYNYYRHAHYIFLTLLLFYVHTYFYRDMTQIRSAVAAAVGLFLIIQLHKKEYYKALLTIVFAGLFHMAALSYLIIYFASFIKITRNKVALWLVFAVVLGGIGISKVVMSVLPNLGYITIKLISYASNEQHVESVSLFDVTNIKNLAIMGFILLFWTKLENKSPYFNTLVLFMFMATFWRLAFADFGIVAARISTFFGVVEVILVPMFILIFRQKIVATFFVLIYAFMLFYLNIGKKLNPYELGVNLF
jgi:hypothetical protein